MSRSAELSAPLARAVVYESFGGPEILHVREVPEPHAGPGEIRIRVAAASLNPMDCPVSTVKSRLYTALDLLKNELAPVRTRGVS